MAGGVSWVGRLYDGADAIWAVDVGDSLRLGEGYEKLSSAFRCLSILTLQ